jgi:nucleoside-diphosphate-sugar epimerase
MENQRILVLGATGLIGLPLATELAKTNHVTGVSRFRKMASQALASRHIEPLEMDIAKDPFNRLPEDIDYVFHEVMLYHPSDLEQSLEVNSYPVARLMERYERCKGIVLGSTGSVYATPGTPRKEDDPVGGVTAYAVSKICAEKFAIHFSRERGTPTCILRYYQPYSAESGIVPSLQRAVAAGRPVDHGKTLYTPMFISDVVRFTIEAASLCASPPRILNVGGEEVVSQEALVRILCEAMGKPPGCVPVSGDSSRLSEIGDCAERIGLLGKEQVPIREGVRRVVAAARQ